MKEGGEVKCVPHRRPPFLMPGHEQPSSQRRRAGRSVSSRPHQTTHDVGSRVGMPSHEVFSTIQYVAGVHHASVGARNGYMYVVLL